MCGINRKIFFCRYSICISEPEIKSHKRIHFFRSKLIIKFILILVIPKINRCSRYSAVSGIFVQVNGLRKLQYP